jgi:hypothetical protein
MYTRQMFFLLVAILAIAQALPITDKRYKLPDGASPIKTPHGTHAYKQEANINVDLSKRVVIGAQNGTVYRPLPAGPGRPQPLKRVVIDGPNGTAIRPTPVGPEHVEPLKRYIIKNPDGTFTRPTPGPGGITPL